MEGNSAGGNDVELLCKTLQVEHKLFYFDLKENPRGRYLKISEKTSSTRSTIIVPSDGINWFLDLFNYYVNSDDQEIFSKELQLQSKVFYFDVGENRRGRFLKIYLVYNSMWKVTIDDKVKLYTSGLKTDLTLPTTIHNTVEFGSGDDYKENVLALKAKMRYDNVKGKFWEILKNEMEWCTNRSTIIVPAGSTEDEGWAAFRNILAEINEASSLFITPNQQTSESTEHIAGLSDDVGAGFISGHSTQSAPLTEINVGKSADLSRPDGGGNNLGFSKVIRADQKRFFCDLGSNNRGHFLKISEVAGSDRSSIILPLSGLKQFHEMVGHFVEITKDKVDGIASANVRTVDPPQR
ncbi:hypothetical protein V2J09_022698 [Rumex salicifolius]